MPRDTRDHMAFSAVGHTLLIFCTAAAGDPRDEPPRPVESRPPGCREDEARVPLS